MATLVIREHVLGRFGSLLIALVFFLVTAPFAEETPFAESRFRVLFTLVLLVGVYTMSGRRDTIVAGLLATPALAGNWLDLGGAAAVGYALSALFVGHVAIVVLAAVLSEVRVTTDTVLGGVCVYFLVGILWTLLYAIALAVDPGAILAHGEPIAGALERGSSTLLYYSFVTLTTLGYGDVVPRSDVARMLAGAEAVVGQLFIAVLIARLVGMHVSMGRQPRP